MDGKLENAPLPATSSMRLVESFPLGLSNAFLFATFNALSFQVVLASPMILYAKSLGASATVLGIIAGMMPLLVIFQIPAAQYVHRVGYKRFVYAGWGTRVTFIFAMAIVPLLSFLDPSARLALMLMLLFIFNLSRGISSCAWLPWITSLVPASIRGKYLAREAACVNCASFVSFLLSGLCLQEQPSAWQFAVLFAFSAVMGAASLVFLKRIPEAETPEQVRTSTTPVPWRDIANHPPFRKLLHMVICWSLAYGGMSTFTVAFLKTEAGIPEGKIMFVTSTAFLGGLSSLWLLGSRMDRLGSKPVLTFSFVAWMIILGGWLALSGRLLSAGLGFILVLQFLMGLSAALVSMATTRLAMAVIPVMGRNHFFALYSVVGSLTLGLSPILWGIVIDAFGPLQIAWSRFEWNRYTIFFAGVELVILATLIFSRRLEEPEAVSMEKLLKEILIQSPLRVWVRLWPRG
jgi:MFS family permease